ncbi:type III PLP-dependent enzyme [uncultured Rhodospira sp.]|mgnify:CR=1 FL=1|uniref:type III PLP-dependent enzyme n=1 Tax=uncultured Rhodospira sp. TaxID=1936189 RepID=UPI003457AA15
MSSIALRADAACAPPPACRLEPAPGGRALSVVRRSPEWIAPGLTRKIAAFLDQHPATPCLVVDLDVVEANYHALRAALPEAEVFYAVKANPAPPLVARLVGLGACFDTASVPEIDLCLALGADPADLSYGNTIKKAADIAAAHARGVSLFAFDAEEELRKIAAHAPGARVFCRLLTDNAGAEWPLSRKFGCSPAMAHDLMRLAARLGLEPVGLSFHVGSQQTDPSQWDHALEPVARLFNDLRADGLAPSMVNLGGGLPTRYTRPVPEVAAYGARIRDAVARLFDTPPRLIVEPGRGLVGDAGVLETEVVLVARKDASEERRWVYLDAGRFNGLAETEGEAIRYPIATAHATDDEPDGPVVLAGPTCDSVDVLYDRAGVRLPLSLKAGDRLRLLSTGAYTTTYSTVGFNGFAPLAAHYV